MPSRRTFLGALGAGALALTLPRRSRAAAFGSQGKGLGMAEELRVKNVLEIYLYGGLSPWESFYLVPGRGKRERRFLHAFDDTENRDALAACGVHGAPSLDFARDARGATVHLGPFARALFARPDLVARLRIVVQQHALLPHEAAVPLAIAGKTVGSPALACLGAHVERAFAERAARDVPYSYVLMNAAAVPSDNTDAFVATGLHPGSARPLRLNVDDASRLLDLLARPAVSQDRRAAYDAYVAARTEGFRSRLRPAGEGEALRCRALREMNAAGGSLEHVDAIARTLPRELLTAPTGRLCGTEDTQNFPLGSLRLAAHLLTHPKTPAGYVCVLDSGLVPASGGGGYDTHSANEQLVQLTNLENLLTSLANVINGPGERNPDKLDLDDTLVLLNTEFGRTPEVQEASGGRNHHPAGYVTVCLGGPVRTRGLFGAIDERGKATVAATPAENRIAALLALGVHPFSPEAYSLSEVAGARTEQEAVQQAVTRFFGVER